MSRYNLTLNGKDYVVEIADIAGSAATVIVNGTPYTVEVPGGIATVAAPAAPVAVAPAPAAPAPAPAAAPVAAAAPAAPVAAPAPAAPAAAASGAGEAVVAPMPGTIISLSVSEGDTVEVGDTVVVMEAMKMENEIKAHVAGTITQILVTAGQDVGVNEAMLTIG
jgi:glutaconyl-CoA decarboxylase